MEIGHTIPLHTLAPAGRGTDYQPGVFADRYLPSALIPHPEWGLGAFEIAGDSMSPYLQPGDIVFVAEQLRRVRSGDILVVGFKNGDHTVKKLRVVDDDHWELVPLNPNHERTTLTVSTDVAWYAPVVGRFEPIWTRREIPWSKDTK